MSHWDILGLGPSILLCDGDRVHEGTWAECHDAMLRGASSDDTVTPGPAIQRVPAGQYRQRHNDYARLCGCPRLVVEAPQ